MPYQSNSESEKKILNGLVQVDEKKIENHLDGIVKKTVEETLNELLNQEADQLCQAGRYERNGDRKAYRSGHYGRKLHTKAGEVDLKVPKLKGVKFETAIIERYRRRESSVEEAMMEMYLAGVSVRRVEDITEALWGTRVSPSTVSDLNKKIYERIEKWRNEPISGKHPYVYLDGVYLKKVWGGEVRAVSILVAIGVNEEGYREILGISEGAREDAESWRKFLKHLKQRGLNGVQLMISDKCLGLVESIHDFYPKAKWQRCIVHYYRNVFSVVPHTKVKAVADMLKAIHAQEDLEAALQKTQQVTEKLKLMKLWDAAKHINESASETLSYYHFPREHWVRIRTNNPLERIMKEIKRRTKVVGAFPDGNSALMLSAARLRHIAGTKWGAKRYLNMKRLVEQKIERRYAQTA